MKHVIIIVAVLLLFISFSFTNSYSSKSIVIRDGNQKELFAATKAFAADVSSMDVNRLKKHFEFPVKDSGIWYYCEINDSLFYNKITGHYKTFGEKEFDKYYKPIFTQASCGLFSLFRTLKLDSLAYDPSIDEYSQLKGNSPCYYHYSIDMDTENSEVVFRYGTVSRTDYTGDGYLKCNEFTSIFTFKLMNGVLMFESENTAD